MKNVTKLLGKCSLVPLGLTEAASQQMQECIARKILDSGHNITTLIISNDETEDIIKTAKYLEILVYYQKELKKQFKMKQKNKNEYFLVCQQVHKV